MARPVLLPVLGVVAAVYTASLAFVGTPQAAPRVSRVPARVSAEYLERLGPKDSDVPFDPSAATGPGASVEFKKRPFGILRYQPGQGLKGAMAMEIIPKSRYPGDPQGQAFASGVQSGWVVTSINGQNVQNEDFGKIMDLLDDEVADPRFSKSTALALEKQGGRLAEPAAAPLAVQFNSIPGYVYKGAELKEDGQDGFARWAFLVCERGISAYLFSFFHDHSIEVATSAPFNAEAKTLDWILKAILRKKKAGLSLSGHQERATPKSYNFEILKAIEDKWASFHWHSSHVVRIMAGQNRSNHQLRVCGTWTVTKSF